MFQEYVVKNKELDKNLEISKRFMQLISRGNTINEITIKELTAHVKIPRSSFYNYFEDVYDLLYWTYKNELFNTSSDLLNNGMHREAFKFIFTKILKEKDFYLTIFKTTPEYSVDRFMYKVFYDVFHKTNKNISNEGNDLKDLMAKFYGNAMANVFTLWLESDCVISLDDILKFSIYTRHTTLHEMVKGQK